MTDFSAQVLISLLSSLMVPSLVFIPLFILHRIFTRIFGERIV